MDKIGYEWRPAKLRLLMDKARVTNDVLAYGSGLGKATVDRIVAGNYTPSMAMLWRIADYFGVSVDYLVGRCSEEENAAVETNYDLFYFGVRMASWEKYLVSRKKGKAVLPTEYGATSPWPYNLLDEIFEESGGWQTPVTDDQFRAMAESIKRHLSENDACALYLYYAKDMTLQEVSEQMDVSMERIRQRISRSVHKLRHPAIQEMIKMGADAHAAMCAMKSKAVQEEQSRDVYATDIYHMDLSTRSFHNLARANISTAMEIVQLPYSTLKAIRGVGKKGILDIANAIHKLGLKMSWERGNSLR